MARKKYIYKCKYCGCSFNPFTRNQVYCSKSCRAKDTGVGHGLKTGQYIPCSWCGKQIWRKGSLLKKFSRFFCDKDCQNNFKKYRQDYSSATGENHPGWKGNNVGYFVLHKWVRKNKGKAKRCIFCGSTSNVQWANKSHTYSRNLDDWLELCKKCHVKYDIENNWGSATKKYAL